MDLTPDWIKDFVLRFGHYPEIKSIKRDKLHGFIMINFADGQSMNCDVKIHRRAECEYKDVRAGKPFTIDGQT